jgi:ABC-type transporter Mla subunit MlaD
MAGRPIEIPIAIDASDVEKGAAKVADSFDDVEKALKDVSKTGEKTGKDLSDDMSDAAKKIDRDLTKALDEVEQKAKSSGKGMGDGVKAGTDKAGEGLSEMKGEVASTAKEAGASFGSIEDGADAMQEILANSLAGFGPLGAAAGVALAVGLGFAFTAMQDGAEKANAMKQAAVDLAGRIEEAGGRIENVDIGSIISDWGREVKEDNWLTFWADESSTNFQDVAKKAEKVGVTAKDAIRGMKGSAEDSQGFLDATKEEYERLNGVIKEGTILTDRGGQTFSDSAKQAMDKKKALEELRKGAEENIATTKDAIQIYNLEKDAVEGTTQSIQDNIDALEERADSQRNAISSEISYLDSVDDLTAAFEEHGATLDRSTKVGRENETAVLDQAAAIAQLAQDSLDAGTDTDLVTSKFQAQKDALINQVMPAFGGSREAARLYIEQVLKTPPAATTQVNLTGVPAAKAELDELGRARTVPLHITPNGTAVENYYTTLQGRKVFIDFAPRGGGQAATLP